MPDLAPAVSVVAWQRMTSAFEDLEQTITPADKQSLRKCTTLQQVRAAALEIEDQLAARQALRNMRRLTPLFQGLEHYAKSVDVLCNGTPFLPWIWSPITLILRIASEYVEAFEKIMKGYSRIAEALGRFEILSDAFVTNHDLQQTLAVFYADILQFHTHAYKIVRRQGWKLLFLTSWGRFERRFENILEDLDRHGTLIDKEANAHNIAEARAMRKDLHAWREESLDQIIRQEQARTAKEHRAILSWLRIDETEQSSILDSIHEEAVKYPGTCAWLTQHAKIKSWLQKNHDTPLLWLQGNPGSGKSVISAQLSTFIRASKEYVLHHFCTYAYIDSTKYDYILKSLLSQLLHKNGELITHVYEDCVMDRKLPTTSSLEQILQKLIVTLSNEPRDTEYIWIILDGVDECESHKQARLISLLNQIASRALLDGGTLCKVLLTSRSPPTMAKLLRKKLVVSLSDQGDHLEKAIQLYASQRLLSMRERFRQLELDIEEIKEVEQLIAKKAHNMFLYARLVLDYISTNIFYSGDELKESIHQLPPILAEFYRKIMMQILVQLDSRSVKRIKCVLGWIAFAKRPLKKLEFLSALSFSSGERNLSKLAPRYILDICGPLIEERRGSTLAFIHSSVKDFLITSSDSLAIISQDALLEHGVAAITCLLAGVQIFNEEYDSQKRLLRVVKGIHGFHIYATEYWTEYLLENSAMTGGVDTSSILFTKVTELVEELENFPVSTLSKQIMSAPSILDKRLHFLGDHPRLQKHVSNALRARSRKRLESELIKKQSSTAALEADSQSHILDGISQVLEAYQETIRILLNCDSCPGASAEELEQFKTQFRTSAYTCRLQSCPRATIGFDTEQLRHEHEMTHAGGFPCPYSGCQYPLLRTSQSLKEHVKNYHTLPPRRKLIVEDKQHRAPAQLLRSVKTSTKRKSNRAIIPAEESKSKPALLFPMEPVAERVETMPITEEVGTEPMVPDSRDSPKPTIDSWNGLWRPINASMAYGSAYVQPVNNYFFYNSAAPTKHIDEEAAEVHSLDIEGEELECVCRFEEDEATITECQYCNASEDIVCIRSSEDLPEGAFSCEGWFMMGDDQ